MKPILFNTEMVRAILEGRKTVTRRLVKPQPGFFYDHGGVVRDPGNPDHISFLAMMPDDHEEIYVPPYQPGEILYVRETWRIRNVFGDWNRCDRSAEIEYRAGGPNITLRNITRRFEDWIRGARWLPSIHMPKKAARIFLRVVSVKPERLRNMVLGDVLMEGITEGDSYDDTWKRWHNTWNSTIKPADLPTYGWEANPWVWVIKFERCEKPEEPHGE